ncbi:hypothetical protein CAP36_16100 [Chitinophagaceae bacterium IBVUCB2]|nr:hypothetical protein CAP36_16100 [Chitinophagaceae bacterium IBVUCB2]
MAVAVQAQEIKDRKSERPQHHQKHPGKKGHHDAMKQLNLTEDQKAKFKSQNEEMRKQMAELKKNDGITVKESREKMASIRKEHKEKTQAILTTEQKTQLEKSRTEGKAKFEAMSKERNAKMKSNLGLTDEQSAKMDKNRAEMATKMKALREDKALSDEQRKEKVKELMKQQKENMKSILTEEQLKKMKEGRGQRPERKEKKTTI